MAFEAVGKMVLSLFRGQYYWDRRRMLQSASRQMKMSQFHVVPLSSAFNGCASPLPLEISCMAVHSPRRLVKHNSKDIMRHRKIFKHTLCARLRGARCPPMSVINSSPTLQKGSYLWLEGIVLSFQVNGGWTRLAHDVGDF
jgi:hypothetical protein